MSPTPAPGPTLQDERDRSGEPTPPRLVRPYVVTRGRTHASGSRLALDAAVQARRTPSELDRSVTPEARRIVALCVAPVSLAELAARLPLPVGAVRVLVGDLTDTGALSVGEGSAPDAARDVALLTRLLDGIRSL